MQVTGGKGSQNLGLETSEAGSGCAVYMSEANNSAARWKVRLQAQIGDSGNFTDVGIFYTSPPRSTTPIGSPGRMLAVAYLPGAKNWNAIISLANNDDSDTNGAVADFELSSYEGSGSFGLRRVGERYSYIAGTSGASAAVTIEFGQKVLSWAAISDGAAASVQIGLGNTITIPAGDAARGNPEGTLQGRFDFNFVHCDYFIELAESA